MGTSACVISQSKPTSNNAMADLIKRNDLMESVGLVIEQKFFAIDDTPNEILVSLLESIRTLHQVL